MIGVQDDHLRRAARLAARLDDAGKRVEALHERHRTRRRAAAREQFLRRADRDRFEPVPDPNLNSMPSVLARPRIDSIVSCTALMKHAEHCGCLLEADS